MITVFVNADLKCCRSEVCFATLGILQVKEIAHAEVIIG
jgi:hypothetical protein